MTYCARQGGATTKLGEGVWEGVEAWKITSASEDIAPPAANVLFIGPPIIEAFLKQSLFNDDDMVIASYSDIIIQIGRILGNCKSPYFPHSQLSTKHVCI